MRWTRWAVPFRLRAEAGHVLIICYKLFTPTPIGPAQLRLSMLWIVSWTRPLSVILGFALLFSGCKSPSLEERLLQCLRKNQPDTLQALMGKDPEAVRNALSGRVKAWANGELSGVPAETHRRETLELARIFDTLTADGYRQRIEFQLSQSPSEQTALKAAREGEVKARELREQGQYEEALAAAGKADAAKRHLNDPYLQALLHVDRGQAFYNLERYPEAEQQFRRAADLYKQTGFRLGAAFVQSELGLIYAALGRLSEARRLFEQALAEQRAMRSPRYVIESLNHLGALYVRMGDLPQGLEMHRQALELEEQIRDTRNQPITLNNLGHTYYLMGQYAMAEPLYRKALAAAEAARLRVVSGLVLNNLGELYLRNGQRELGLEFLEKALQVKSDSHGSVYYKVWTLRALGDAYASLGRWSEAEMYVAQALAYAPSLQTGTVNAILLANVYDLKGRLQRDQGRVREAAAAFGQAIESIEAQLADLDAHHWKTSLLSSIQDIYHNMILLQHERLGDTRTAFHFAEKARARAFLDLAGGQVQFDYGAELALGARRIRDVVSRTHLHPLDADSLQRVLPRDVTLVEYTVMQDRLIIWVLGTSGLRSEVVYVTRDRLNELAQSFREAVTLGDVEFRRRFPTWSDMLREVRARSGELYKFLVQPIKGYLNPQRMVCFIPDEMLYYVPFAALVDPTTDEYLVETYTLFYAPSATLFALSQDMQQRKKRARPLLIVDNPTIGRDVRKAYPYLRPLPDVDWSGPGGAPLYRDAHVLKSADAGKSAVLAAMPDYEIVHFYTHGILADRQPLLSTLILAPDPNPSAQARANDGRLYTHEIFQLKLERTRLLTLAACETALGALWRGEGVVGLSRAVFYAGVPSLIITQWKVEARPSTQLMTMFYKQLRTHSNIAEALTLAQRTFLRDAEGPWDRHPSAWSGFCLMGAYRLKILPRGKEI